MPKKACNNCGTQVGPRTKACSCGNVFSGTAQGQKSASVALAPKEGTMEEAKTRQNLTSARKMKVCIAVPSGHCPIKPSGFKAYPHEEIDASKIGDWAEKVYSLEDGKYSIDAVVYWARNFWDINSREFSKVVDFIIARLDPDSDSEIKNN